MFPITSNTTILYQAKNTFAYHRVSTISNQAKTILNLQAVAEVCQTPDRSRRTKVSGGTARLCDYLTPGVSDGSPPYLTYLCSVTASPS